MNLYNMIIDYLGALPVEATIFQQLLWLFIGVAVLLAAVAFLALILRVVVAFFMPR